MRRTRAPLVPTLVALAGALCGTAASAASQTIGGMVFSDAGPAVAGATVRLLTVNAVPVLETPADAFGRYSIEIPAAGMWVVLAEAAGFATSAPEVVEVSAGEDASVMLELRLLTGAGADVEVEASARQGEDAFVYGEILRGHSSQALEGAVVTLEGTGLKATSSRNGRFLFPDVPVGPVKLTVEYLGFATQETVLDPRGGTAYHLRVRMQEEAIEVEGIEVSVKGRSQALMLRPVFERMNRSIGGHFIAGAQLEQRGGSPVATILSRIPSTDVRCEGVRCMVLFKRFGMASIGTGGSGCRPVVYLDGVRLSAPDGTGGEDILAMASSEVEIIEAYPGPSSLPPEFNDPGTECAVAIWTRRGG